RRRFAMEREVHPRARRLHRGQHSDRVERPREESIMKHVEHRPTRFALVGVDRIGTSHLEALSQVGSASLEAVVDPRRAAAEAVAEQKGVRWFEEYESPELLDMIDAVIICTPPNLHYDIARHFLTSGKHVLCEK